MKITCDNCGAKYSIADEKIRGKVFKIRCKRCSQAIVVRGESGPSGETSAANTRGEPKAPSFAGEDLVWHVVVGREQIGPISSNEVRNRIQRGEVNDRTYVWRESFSDWQRLADVPELARDLAARPVESAGQPAQEAALAKKAPSGDWNATVGMAQDAANLAAEQAPFISAEYQSHDPGHLREEPARAVVGGGGGGRAASGHAGLEAVGTSEHQDAFLGFSVASAQRGGEDIFASARRSDGGKDGAERRMTGQRGENSVLFSLDSLQAMATGSSSTQSSGRTTPEKDRRSDEGSALIDLRAMAATVAPLRTTPDPADTPTIGAFSGFSTAVAAPAILIPSAGEAQPRWVLPTIIGLAVALIASITVLAIILLRRPVAQVEALGPAAGHVAAQTAGPVKGVPPSSAAQPATAGTPKAGTAPSEAKEPAERETNHAAAPSNESKPRAHLRPTKAAGHRGAADVSATAAASPASHLEPPRAKPRKHDELDDLIDSAMSKKGGGGGGGQRAAPLGGAAAGGVSDLPAMLSHDQIRAGMQDVNPRVRACFDRFKVPGIANVRVTISGSGRVTATSVSGIFEGTPTGDCVERAARQAHFEQFKKPSMSFTMPFVLR